jgi:N-acetyl-anhydromuramyl-L-alanine amidase AmpD
MKNKLSENESKVLEHLKEYSLTTLQAVTNLHILNVQDVIMRLKKYGYKIEKEWKTSKGRWYDIFRTKAAANRKRYAEYKLVR